MANKRYEALDSWRGMSACLVALFHFLTYSHLTSWNLIRNAYLVVDLFFVLSGFVIAANYRARLAEGFGFTRFMVLRFGRIYPLHFATMLFLIPVDMAKGIGSSLWRAVATNTLLIHGLGVNGMLWLNFPSWSISTEFAAYVVFGVVVVLFGQGLLAWVVPLIAAPLVLGLISPNGMDATFDYGFARCIYGFALGVICFDLRERLPGLRRLLGRRIDTAIEIATFAAVLAWLGLVQGPHSVAIASPLLFAVVVLVYAREGGAVSDVLKTGPLLLVGTLSYSIYMVHAPVRAVSRAAAMVFERLSGGSLFMDVGVGSNGEVIRLLDFGGSLWLGDLVQIALLGATVALATLTYRYIEEPGRRWSRRIAARLPGPATAASSTA